jgi:phage-related protein
MQRIKIPSCDSGCGEDCEGLANHEDTNSGMVKQSLYRLVKLSAMLHDLIEKSDKGAEPWVLSKVTEALNHVESVYGYMDYEHFKDQVISDIEEVSEETEADLYDSISRGGKSIVSKLRSVLSTESRETIEELVYEAITALESR